MSETDEDIERRMTGLDRTDSPEIVVRVGEVREWLHEILRLQARVRELEELVRYFSFGEV